MKKRWFCLCLTGVLCLSPAFGQLSYADSLQSSEETASQSNAESSTGETEAGISEERLQDRIIEYDELGSLIHANNLQIQKMVKSTEDTREEYTKMRDSLKTERDSAVLERDNAKENGDMEEYAENAMLAAIYSSSVRSYNKMLDKLDRYASNKNVISMEKQLTNAAQSLMISLQSLRQQKEYMGVMEELYHTQYENAVVQQTAGLATSQDVLSAYNAWTDMSVSLDSITDTERSLYDQFYLILGMEDREGLELQNIPSVDLNRLSELDLEADTRKAIGSNTDVVNARNNTYPDSSGKNSKLRTLEELEESVTIKMQQLYEAVLQAKQSYDAAASGYAAAQLTWENAQRKKKLGMLSDAQYLQECMQYTMKKTAFEAADLGLFQALETYDWAVKGIVNLD